MGIVRYVRDPAKPHVMSAETRARLDALTDEQITAAAESDPDNPPLTDAELARLRAARVAKAARQRTGLSQAKFAEAYHIKVARLRDVEQARRAPDPVLVSLLTLIHDDPERVARVLGEDA